MSRVKLTAFAMIIGLLDVVFVLACADEEDDNEYTEGHGEADTDSDGNTDADTNREDDEGFLVTDRVEMITNMGTFIVGLYGEEAPITVANFLDYVNSGFYDQTVFHRVIADFMVQGGGFDTELNNLEANPPIELEIAPKLSHQPGVISMARTADPNSATSEFFICVADNSNLDEEYAAFGMVESGYGIVEKISLVDTHTVGAYEDVPVEKVIIESVTLLD